MKKIISFALALVMLLSLSTVAFAAGAGDHIGEVKGQYKDNTTTPEVISVDIRWGNMEFTYTESGSHVWNPGTHTYTDNSQGTWTPADNTVKVTNHSNVDVEVSFAFAPLEGHSVTGTFSTPSKTLASAENYVDPATGDSVTTTLTLAGSLDESVTTLTKIGTITVTIE